MRKVILGIVFISLLASCKKNNTPAISSGSWTFNGVTYNDGYGECLKNSSGQIVSIVANTSKFSNVYFTAAFLNTPTITSGNYILLPGQTSYIGRGISIDIADSSGTPYISSQDNPPVSVLVQSNGTIAISGSNITMLNYSFTDSFKLSFNITQTY